MPEHTPDPIGSDEPRPLYTSRRLRRRSGGSPAPWIAAGVAALAIAGGLAWYLTRGAGDPDVPAPAVDARPPGPAVPEGPVAGARSPAEDLPPLDASDELVRRLAAALSSHPALASWLASDELIRTFVVAVVRVAEGQSPASRLAFLKPEGRYSVREAGGRTVAGPAGYRRYDAMTAAFVSLDAEGVAELYRRLRPLIDAAYAELGLREKSFDAVLGRAVGRLVAAPVPEGPVEVVQDEAVWAYADPTLESRTPAVKHLLRTGPENAARIQTKLRELAAATGIEPVRP